MVKSYQGKPTAPAPKKLLNQACTELVERVRGAICLKHHSIRIKQAYVNWIKRYIYFRNVCTGSSGLSHSPGRGAKGSPPPPLDALLFLCRERLEQDLDSSYSRMSLTNTRFLHLPSNSLQKICAQGPKTSTSPRPEPSTRAQAEGARPEGSAESSNRPSVIAAKPSRPITRFVPLTPGTIVALERVLRNYNEWEE